MTYLLDTNISVFVIRQKSQLVLRRLRQHGVGEVGISFILLAELRYGADKCQHPSANHAALDAFIAPLEICPFDAGAADRYGKIRSDLIARRFGHPLGGRPIYPAKSKSKPEVPARPPTPPSPESPG